MGQLTSTNETNHVMNSTKITVCPTKQIEQLTEDSKSTASGKTDTNDDETVFRIMIVVWETESDN